MRSVVGPVAPRQRQRQTCPQTLLHTRVLEQAYTTSEVGVQAALGAPLASRGRQSAPRTSSRADEDEGLRERRHKAKGGGAIMSSQPPPGCQDWLQEPAAAVRRWWCTRNSEPARWTKACSARVRTHRAGADGRAVLHEHLDHLAADLRLRSVRVSAWHTPGGWSSRPRSPHPSGVCPHARAATRPPTSISFMSFMASMMPTAWPFLTLSPGLTNGASPGADACVPLGRLVRLSPRSVPNDWHEDSGCVPRAGVEHSLSPHLVERASHGRHNLDAVDLGGAGRHGRRRWRGRGGRRRWRSSGRGGHGRGSRHGRRRGGRWQVLRAGSVGGAHAHTCRRPRRAVPPMSSSSHQAPTRRTCTTGASA